MSVYVDTSALAKWYIHEAGSERFERWILNADDPAISSLTAVEMRCLLQRRRRAGEIEPDLAQDIWLAFQEDIATGMLLAYPILDSHMFAAAQLIEQLSDVPLRTLDALHLAVTRANAVDAIATADLVIKRAVKTLKLQLVEF